MRPKYYFRNINDEICYTLDYHLSDAKDEGLKEIELFEAIPEKVEGFYYCKAVEAPAEKDFCGKNCEDYIPRNGKNGMCRHKARFFFTPGNKITFKGF